MAPTSKHDLVTKILHSMDKPDDRSDSANANKFRLMVKTMGGDIRDFRFDEDAQDMRSKYLNISNCIVAKDKIILDLDGKLKTAKADVQKLKVKFAKSKTLPLEELLESQAMRIYQLEKQIGASASGSAQQGNPAPEDANASSQIHAERKAALVERDDAINARRDAEAALEKVQQTLRVTQQGLAVTRQALNSAQNDVNDLKSQLTVAQKVLDKTKEYFEAFVSPHVYRICTRNGLKRYNEALKGEPYWLRR